MSQSVHLDREPDSVKARLLQVLQDKKLSQTEFAKMLGVSPTYIGAMRKSLSNDRMKKLGEIFPDLNRDWLLYGEGDMYRNGNRDEEGDIAQEYIVPLLPVQAFAGNLQNWSEGVLMRDCEKIISPVPGADMAIRISGDSMEPSFHNGATLLIKRINEKAFIPWGNAMVIDTENGVLVKAVFPVEKRNDDDEDAIEARSFNPAYPPIRIPTSCIFSLYKILSQISLYNTM